MPQLFRRRADTTIRIVFGALLVLPVASFALARIYVGSGYTTGQDVTIKQPIPFSHQHHVGALGIDCRNCHASVETSASAGFPATEVCMTCHSQLWTNAKMLAPARDSFANNMPLHWNVVHRLPGYVYFDHSIHIAKGVGCSTCHGAVQTMPLMRQAAPLTMGWCLDCHRQPEAHLRPRADLFNMEWIEPENQLAQGRKLLTEYHVQTERLTDCSTCHR